MAHMPKYKVEHYENKIKRHFDPLIEEQELLVKQYKTNTTDRIMSKLAKKMGADKILNALEKAEMQLERAQHQAKTFFIKKAKKDEDGNKDLTYDMERENKPATLSMCREQLRKWAETLVDREIRTRPEGKQLAQLEALKQKSEDIVYENGDDLAIAKALDDCTKKIGITWVVDTSKIKQIASK
jgi:hypothetical protein